MVDTRFQPGDRVTVQYGPHALIGTVVCIETGKCPEHDSPVYRVCVSGAENDGGPYQAYPTYCEAVLQRPN